MLYVFVQLIIHVVKDKKNIKINLLPSLVHILHFINKLV